MAGRPWPWGVSERRQRLSDYARHCGEHGQLDVLLHGGVSFDRRRPLVRLITRWFLFIFSRWNLKRRLTEKNFARGVHLCTRYSVIETVTNERTGRTVGRRW